MIFRHASLLLIISIFTFSSCIPRKKVMYLQNQEELSYAEEEILKLDSKFEYKLKVGDILSVKILSITPEKYAFQDVEGSVNSAEDPLLSGHIIDEDGVIDIPFIGKVRVEGLSLNKARELIKNQAKDKLIDPNINLRLLTYNYTILGEVNRPGTFTSYRDEINIFEALGSAGDMTDFAERSFVKVVRQENEGVKVSHIDILDKSIVTSEFYFLRPGDLIYVPPLKAKNFNRYQLPNIALAASVLTVISLFILRLN